MVFTDLSVPDDKEASPGRSLSARSLIAPQTNGLQFCPLTETKKKKKRRQNAAAHRARSDRAGRPEEEESQQTLRESHFVIWTEVRLLRATHPRLTAELLLPVGRSSKQRECQITVCRQTRTSLWSQSERICLIQNQNQNHSPVKAAVCSSGEELLITPLF